MVYINKNVVIYVIIKPIIYINAKSKELLIVNYVVNAIGGVLFGFYILRKN
jgi:hypothetical protein